MDGVLRTLTATNLRTLGAVSVLIGAAVVAAVSLFKLSVFGAFALYFVVWWTLLFAVLPLRNQVEADPAMLVPGQDPGAPALPRLREKAVWTTLLSSIAFLMAIAAFPLAGL